MKRLLPILAAAAIAAACARPTQVVVYEAPPVVQPVETAMPPRPTTEGSLFDPVSASWSPWRDDTARNIGDILTVRVSVDNQAENSATTDLEKASTLDYSVTSLLGNENTFPGVKDTTNNTTPEQLIKSSSSNNFKGDGETKRTGKVTADISVIVLQVYANGNMRIHGSQSLLINSENTLLTVDGIVRPADVSVGNIVSSDRIANARIEITGKGVVSDKQHPGFLARVLDWFWIM